MRGMVSKGTGSKLHFKNTYILYTTTTTTTTTTAAETTTTTTTTQ
jgi:hypothetical protein